MFKCDISIHSYLSIDRYRTPPGSLGSYVRKARYKDLRTTHTGGFEELCLLACNAVYSVECEPTFRRNVLLAQRYVQGDNALQIQSSFKFNLYSRQCVRTTVLMACRHEGYPRYPLDRTLSGPGTGTESKKILHLAGLQPLDLPACSQSPCHVSGGTKENHRNS